MKIPGWLAEGNRLAGLLLLAGPLVVFLLKDREGGDRPSLQVTAAGCLSALAGLSVLLFGMGKPLAAYDLRPLAQLAAQHQEAGLATARYQGELGFLGRLTRQVEEIPLPDMKAWMQAHPGGMVFLAYKGEQPELGMAPVFDMTYRSRRLAAWVAPERE